MRNNKEECIEFLRKLALLMESTNDYSYEAGVHSMTVLFGLNDPLQQRYTIFSGDIPLEELKELLRG